VSHFQRRNDRFRHKRQDNTRVSGGSTEAGTEKTLPLEMLAAKRFSLQPPNRSTEF
jgi:hypothetical protein